MDIVVTDLTPMHAGHVCLAGLALQSGACVRPLARAQPHPLYLTEAFVRQHHVVPGSILRANFQPRPLAAIPHVEDHLYAADGLRVMGEVGSDEFEALLEASAHDTVAGGFGMPLEEAKSYDPNRPPPRSLMTLRLGSPDDLLLEITTFDGRADLKASVTDGSQHRLMRIKVNDLLYSLHLPRLRAADPLLRQLNAFIYRQRRVYVRLGIGRAWAPQGQAPKHWIQLNGIYTFPEFRRDLRQYG